MSDKDKDKHHGKSGEDHPHRRRELHEDEHGRPHHHAEDHVRHHHRQHILHHKLDETAEEKKFVNQENYLHRVEMNKDIWEDEGARKLLRKSARASATPNLSAPQVDADGMPLLSATPATAAKKNTPKVAQSTSARLDRIRQRIAFARSVNRQRGEMVFGK